MIPFTFFSFILCLILCQTFTYGGGFDSSGKLHDIPTVFEPCKDSNGKLHNIASTPWISFDKCICRKNSSEIDKINFEIETWISFNECICRN